MKNEEKRNEFWTSDIQINKSLFPKLFELSQLKSTAMEKMISFYSLIVRSKFGVYRLMIISLGLKVRLGIQVL